MIERCCIPRLVRLDGRGYRLAPPTVRQAVEVLHVLDYATEPEDVDLLADLVVGFDWSPSLTLRRGLIKRLWDENPVALKLQVYNAITQGYSPEKIAKAASTKDRKLTSKKGVDYSALIEQYREVYGGSRWAVWNELPFVFLLESMNDLPQHRARKQLMRATTNHPSKSTVEKWGKQAAGEEPEKDKNTLMFEDLTPEELEKEKQAARKQYIRN